MERERERGKERKRFIVLLMQLYHLTKIARGKASDLQTCRSLLNKPQ